MAVTEVRKVYDGRGASKSWPAGRDFTDAYVVVMDTSGALSALEAMTASAGGVAVPQMGSPLLDGALATGMVVTGVSVKPLKSHLIWRVEVTYSAGMFGGAGGGGGRNVGAGHGEGGLGEIGGGGGGGENPGNVPGGGEGGGGVAGDGTPAANPQQIENPLLRPVQAQYRTIKRSVVMKRQNGAPLTNAAGDLFDPPLEREKPYLQMVITHNTATFNRTLIELYVGAINSATWLGFAAKTVMLTDLQATLRFESNVFFWERTFTFEVDRDGYHPVKVLNAGWNRLDGGDRKPITLDFGRTPTRPVLLDAAGAVLAVGAAEVFREFDDVYAEEDFADLGLN